MKQRIPLNIKKLLIPIVLTMIAGIYFTIHSDAFLTAANISAITREMATAVLIGCGMCFVMASGAIDLSVGAIVAFLCMLSSRMMDIGIPTAINLLIVIAVGVACGFINSLVLHTFQLNPFIATLAMQNVYRGLVWIICYRHEDGAAYSQSIKNALIKALNKGIDVGSVTIYYCVIAAIICVVLCHIVMKRTKFGINIYAMGSNEKAASLSGINTIAVQRGAYMVCGAFCGITSIFMLARTQSATTNLGVGLEFDGISALVVGGASAMGSDAGGETSPVGALFGALFLYVIYNGIYKLGIATAYQQIIQGAALIVMLVVDSIVTMIRNHRQRAGYGLEQSKMILEGTQNG